MWNDYQLLFHLVLFAIFRFITTLLERGRHPELFPPILLKLVDILTTLMQITAEQVYQSVTTLFM